MDVVVRRADVGDVDEVVRQRLAFLAAVRDEGAHADGDFVASTRQFIEDEVAKGRMHSWLAEHDATDDGRPLYESAGFRANPNWLERREGSSQRPV